MIKTINIAIVDDHPMVVTGFTTILKPYKHIRVINTYTNSADLLAGLKQEQPEVLVLDISLPDQSAKDIVPMLIKTYPEMQILICTSLDSPAMVNNMMRNGCRGYLLKGAGSATLVEAIETVGRKDIFLDPALKDVLFRNVIKFKKHLPDQPLLPKLSQREKEILRLIANEYTTKEIAESLSISFRTAENHRYNLIQKLDVKNTAGLVKLAIQMGLV